MTELYKRKTLLNSQTRGMHTKSAEYTTFITFEPINRKSGGKATHITAFQKLREERTKKQEKQPQASINLSKRRFKGGGGSSPSDGDCWQ